MNTFSKMFVPVFPVLFFAYCGAVTDPNSLTPQEGGPISDSETVQYRACMQDSDCVYVQNGCCDCANGGKDIAVHTTRFDEFKALFKCENVSCGLMAAFPACGSGTVSCKSSLCEYTKTTEETPQI